MTTSQPKSFLITGAFLLAVCCLALVVLYSLFGHHHHDPRAMCQPNLKQISLGIQQYLADYDDRFPLAKTWVVSTQPYILSEKILQCPLRGQNPVEYAFNSNLSGAKWDQVRSPATTVAIFETSAIGANPSDNGISYLDPPVHLEGNNNAFVDSHVKWTRNKPSRSAWIITAKPQKHPDRNSAGSTQQ